jgi:hypothetical protein
MKNKIIKKWWNSLSIKEREDLINQYNSFYSFNGKVFATYNLNFLPNFFIEKIAQKQGIVELF